MHRYMVSIDDDPFQSAPIEIAMARALECVTIEYCTSRKKDDSGSLDAVMQLEHCAQLLKEMLADHQTYTDSRMKYDIKKNHRTEKVERAWAALIKNKANLDEFKKGCPDTVYLEARKIFLPQGATLILEYWQRELNAFVSELETVSRSISMRGRHRPFHDPTNTSQTSDNPARLEPQKVSPCSLAHIMDKATNDMIRLLPSSCTICLGLLGRAGLACLTSRHIQTCRYRW